MRKRELIVVLLLCTGKLFSQITPTDYSNPANWAAHPMKGSSDFKFNPSYTSISADTSVKTVVNVPYDTTSNVDIFAVYATTVPSDEHCVGLPLTPAENYPVSNPCYQLAANEILSSEFGIYAKFGRIYAPYYRQANLGTFLTPPTSKALQAEIFDTAIADILAAFRYYMQNNYKPGRRLILLGHSQGADLLSMVMRKMEADSVQYPYIKNIFVAILAGYEAGPYAAKNKTTGGWMKNYPICQHPLDTGCICTWGTHKYDTTWSSIPVGDRVAYNTILQDSNYMYNILDTTVNYVLNDPLVYTNTFKVVSGMFIPNNSLYISPTYYPSVTTPFIYYPTIDKALISQPNALNYGLMVDTIGIPNDNRYNPLDTVKSDEHIWDMFFTAGDELNLIQQKLSQIVNTGIATPEQRYLETSVYPNPSAGKIFINIPNIPVQQETQITYTIRDITGRAVKTFSEESQEKFPMQLDVSNLSNGVYLLEMNSSSFNLTRKFIIIH